MALSDVAGVEVALDGCNGSLGVVEGAEAQRRNSNYRDHFVGEPFEDRGILVIGSGGLPIQAARFRRIDRFGA